jgi:hypothetical protein
MHVRCKGKEPNKPASQSNPGLESSCCVIHPAQNTYFQAAFRVQSPWTFHNPGGQNPNAEAIIKHECYIFDFAPDRALRQIGEYASRLNMNETASPEAKVAEFIRFLPVLLTIAVP